MDKPEIYTELTCITTLPAWALRVIDDLIQFVAWISGHRVIISSVKRSGGDDEQV